MDDTMVYFPNGRRLRKVAHVCQCCSYYGQLFSDMDCDAFKPWKSVTCRVAEFCSPDVFRHRIFPVLNM